MTLYRLVANTSFYTPKSPHNMNNKPILSYE